jgi:hypothetical protein
LKPFEKVQRTVWVKAFIKPLAGKPKDIVIGIEIKNITAAAARDKVKKPLGSVDFLVKKFSACVWVLSLSA